MAADTEDLVLSISADVRQMKRALDRVVGDTAKATSQIEKQFDAMSVNTTGAFNRTATGANRAFTVIEGGARRVNTAIKGSSFQTANLASQLNDIGVQLAGGTSPFQIAIQQGTQINQVLGQSGARGAVAALGGAFASLVNPVSLATFAIIALGGTAVQYFATLLSEGEKSAKVLEEEAALIQKVADKWGDALPALRAYANERQKLADQTDIEGATQAAIEQAFAGSAATVNSLRSDLGLLIDDLTTMGGKEADVGRLQDAFNELDAKIANNTATAADAQAVQQVLADIMVSTGIPAADALANAFLNLANAIATASAESAAFNADIASPIGGEKIAGDKSSRSGRNLNPAQERNLATRLNPSLFIQGGTSAGRSAGGGRSASASEAEREAEAVRKLIEDLQFEQSLIGKTDEQRKVATALRKAGAAATDEQKAKIEELVLAIERENEAIKQSEAAMKALQDIGKEVLSGFISDLQAGKSASEALANALQRVADKLLNIGLDALFGGLGGGFGRGRGLLGGAIIPGILHSGGVAGKDGYGHGRSVSPSVFAGAPRYHQGGIAGLRPGEVPAILQKGEMVIPRGGRGPGYGGRDGGSVTIRVIGEEGPMFRPYVQAESKGVAVQVVQAGISKYDKRLDKTLGGKMAMAQARTL